MPVAGDNPDLPSPPQGLGDLIHLPPTLTVGGGGGESVGNPQDDIPLGDLHKPNPQW